MILQQGSVQAFGTRDEIIPVITGRKPPEHPGGRVIRRPHHRLDKETIRHEVRHGQQEIAVRTAATEGTWSNSLPRSTRLPTIGGILVMAVMLMGFGVWGYKAPIAGAVVVSGVL